MQWLVLQLVLVKAKAGFTLHEHLWWFHLKMLEYRGLR